MRGAVRWAVCVALILCAPARAQSSDAPFDATTIGTPANLSSATWRFALGDDPRWSDPAFDDSQWKIFTPEKNFKAQGMSVPSGMWWYRLHVQVRPGSKTLAITGIESSYQLYVNGRLIGQQGGFPNRPRLYRAVPQLYPIPPDAIASGSMTIAVRQWLSPFFGQFEYGFTGGILLGNWGWLSDYRSLGRDSTLFDSFEDIAQGLIGFMVGIWALALFRAQPEHREYLCLAVMGLIDATLGCISAPIQLAQLPLMEVILPGSILSVLYRIALVLFVCAFLRVRVTTWIRAYCVALFLAPITFASMYSGWIPHRYYIIRTVSSSRPRLTSLLRCWPFANTAGETGKPASCFCLSCFSQPRDYDYLFV